MVHKKIAQSFGKATQSYDRAARLQRFVGKQLIGFLNIDQLNNVVDLGSGTGFFTDVIASQSDQVIAVDLSEEMLAENRAGDMENVYRVCADAENIPVADNCIAQIYSSLMIQWCPHPEQVLAEAKRMLESDGIFVFSTLLDGTLTELKNAWACVDDDKHVNDFLTHDELNDICNAAGYSDVHVVVDSVCLDYNSVKELATELKGLGANYVKDKQNKGLMGRKTWQKLNLAYERNRRQDGTLPATYEVAYVYLVK